ncbi:J domain-containing protein [Synechococcus sp. MIT S1220]|uniref:J domain-containing protein n=1 Tax=Synechococcus sp. MIT S1220 TaxID=3082549 RepID=UPI0039B0D444
MGFDPRNWSQAQKVRARDRVTGNIEDLIAENAALQREIQQLKRRVHGLERRLLSQENSQGRTDRTWDRTEPSVDQITAVQIQRWGEILQQQPHWITLDQQRLQHLIEDLNRQSFHSDLSLEQRLERLQPGLGQSLGRAMGTPRTKADWAVRAAFALYGVRSMEWLDEDPKRVVDELQRRQGQRRSGRRTRSDRRASDRDPSMDDNPQMQTRVRNKAEANAVLGVKEGASEQDIKQAHRKLVKKHHPDMGGSAEQFRRVNEAYQYLIRLTTKD